MSARDVIISTVIARSPCDDRVRRSSKSEGGSNPACMRVAGLLRTPGARSRDPLARNDVEGLVKTPAATPA
jgi:hypothetical protein